jgi:hypothetical protein
MTDDTLKPKRGPSDATDYSSTKAPETQKGAEERDPQSSDPRLWPGGRNAAPVDPGIGSLDRKTTFGGEANDNSAEDPRTHRRASVQSEA